MKRVGIVLLVAALTAASPAMAGGYGYYGGHSHKHDDDKYGYLAAGLILGGLFTSIVTRPRHRSAPPLRHYYSAAGYYPPPAILYTYSTPAYVERTVVVQQPPAAVYRRPSTTVRRTLPTEGTYYLKRADGDCFLVENRPNGDQILRPQPPEACP